MNTDHEAEGPSEAMGADRLLRTAHRLFLEHGYANVSMQRIAHEAGMTKGAPYYHYENKQALFEAVCRQVIITLRDSLLAPFATAGTLGDHLRDGLTAAVEGAEGVLSVWVADFQRVLAPSTQSALLHNLVGFSDLRHLLVPVFSEAAKRGERLTVPPESASNIFMKLLIMTIDEDRYLARYGLLRDGSRERTIDELVRVFLDGAAGRLD